MKRIQAGEASLEETGVLPRSHRQRLRTNRGTRAFQNIPDQVDELFTLTANIGVYFEQLA